MQEPRYPKTLRAMTTAAVLSVLGAAAGGAPALQVAHEAPGPQASHLLVYDERIQRVVLITGYSAPGASATGEMWTFDGRRWERVRNSPELPARYLAGAAYDSGRRQLVVFGGRVGKEAFARGDTWIWDGSAWHDRSDASVGIREHHTMAYDASRERTVMYGGTIPAADTPPRSPAARTWPADIWEWDGARWHRPEASGPGARNGTAIAYDERRKQVVLFGGVGEDRLYRTGTWTWDGKVWREAAKEGPPLRASHQMTFDSRAGVVLLYGGGFTDGTNSVRRQDMWKWDGTRWSEIPMVGPTPGPRNGYAMAYDGARGRLVLYGGFGAGPSALEDTWEWDGARWTEITR